MWHLSWAGAAAVIGATSVLIAVLTGSGALTGIGAVVTLAVVVAGVVVPRLRWSRWRWALTDEGLELAHGVVVRVDSSIPAFRVQQVDVRQGPIEGWLGLVSLQVTTASTASDGTLPGLAPETAEAVRRDLLSRVAADDGV
jgi:membrane protein YdbS with pleckstrin-like domain